MPKSRYVPLLRSKTGEADALKNLDGAVRGRLFPLIHLVHKPPAAFADDVAPAWAGLPLALDGTFHVELTGATTQLAQMFDKLGKGKVKVIPSVEQDATANYLATVKKLKDRFAPGLVLKVKLNQLPTVASWVATQGWAPNEIDLVVTLNEIAGFDPDLLHPMVAKALTDNIGTSSPWRSITLGASAAPKDHGGLPAGRSLVPRRDWQVWRSVSKTVPFQLDYGDYGTATPDLTDPPGLAMTRATVSVRYTLDDNWIVRKGTPTRGKKGQPMDKQYRDHAKALAAEPKFGGLANCWGDARIQQIASGAPRSGNRTTWVSIAANRHLSFIASALP